MKNKILDLFPWTSFEKSGFQRHQKSFSPLPKATKSLNVLVTGGTSGIGAAIVQDLTLAGHHVYYTGRRKIAQPDHHYVEMDLSRWDQFSDFHQMQKPFDVLVFNAGGMPATYEKNIFDCEYQTSSQLLGHLFLFEKLHQQNKISPDAKIIWVSSGGMLLKKLDLDNLFSPDDYDKVQQYANVKRAQVILSEVLAKQYPSFFWASMHPGWVHTPGVVDALPRFFQWTQNRLRTPQEGADTILWLLLQPERLPSGKFWFDRQISATHPLLVTQETATARRELLEKIDVFRQKLKKISH